MTIVLLTIAVIMTLCAGGISAYAMYITSQVTGEKLLTLNSELGYKYATTYHTWQTAAVIVSVLALAMWVIFILVLVKRHKKKKKLMVNPVSENIVVNNSKDSAINSTGK